MENILQKNKNNDLYLPYIFFSRKLEKLIFPIRIRLSKSCSEVPKLYYYIRYL